MKMNYILAIAGLILAIIATTGCAVHTAQSTTPTAVTAEVLASSETKVVDGETYDVVHGTLPSTGGTIIVPIEDTTNVSLPRQKRGCLGAMALGGLAGTAGGAAYGSIRYPNDVEVSESRVDVWFDATWKYAAVGASASALITGAICFATR